MALKFYLNDELVTLSHARADQTVLEFLREEKRLKGTKEGCGEGDCGACTVLIGRVQSGALRYQSMNACIAFLPMLHDAHLVTIEALSAGGSMHWIQSALVEFAGSQCGFCTPGIVMSLYSAWMNAEAALDYEGWQTALQGNLCRCTGYASILRAMLAHQSENERLQDVLSLHKSDMLSKLEALRGDMLAMEGDAPFFVPQTRTELEAVYAMNPSATLVAGATDVGLWVTKHLRSIAPVVFLGQVEELQQIGSEDTHIRIGAGVSFNDAKKTMCDAYPELEPVWLRIAGEQVRNLGTIGGNIANGSPIGDTPPILIALDTRLVLNHGGTRREIALEDFFIDYGKQDRAQGEFVEAILIPKSSKSIRVYKVSKRRDDDISAVFCALSAHWEAGKAKDVRLAFGGMAATPKRARNAEAALEGQPWNEENIRKAMAALDQDFTPLSDMRASAEYRMKTAQNLLLRAYEDGFGKEAAE